MSDEPNRVVQSSRKIIEHKLLTALGDPFTVAILASKDDLDLLIFSLEKTAIDGRGNRPAVDGDFREAGEAAREICAREYVQSLKQLRREAFGK